MTAQPISGATHAGKHTEAQMLAKCQEAFNEGLDKIAHNRKLVPLFIQIHEQLVTVVRLITNAATETSGVQKGRQLIEKHLTTMRALEPKSAALAESVFADIFGYLVWQCSEWE